MVNMLLCAGAVKNLAITNLAFAMFNSWYIDVVTVIRSFEHDNEIVLNECIIHNMEYIIDGSDPELGTTYLMCAIKCKANKCAHINYGADIYVEDSETRSAMQYAIEHDNEECIHMIELAMFTLPML